MSKIQQFHRVAIITDNSDSGYIKTVMIMSTDEEIEKTGMVVTDNGEKIPLDDLEPLDRECFGDENFWRSVFEI